MRAAVLLTIAAVAASLVPGQWLELQRGGGWWNVVTCHFTHWTLEQLLWDGLAFAALAIACARNNARVFHATVFAAVVTVPLAVLILAPEVSAYRGLSGLASALFALLLTQLRWSWPVALCTLGIAAKISFESLTGTTMFVQNLGNDVVPVPIAHLAGALTGVAAGIFARVTRTADVLAGRTAVVPAADS